MSDLQIIQERREALKASYVRYRHKKRLFMLGLVPLAFMAMVSTVAIGSADISFTDVYGAIFEKLFSMSSFEIGQTSLIIWKLRLPRVVMGFLVGLALGSSGAVMQVVLKNSLADPYMLGIASAAGFGASLGIVLGVGILSGPYLVMGNAFLFSLLSAGVVLALSGRRGSSPESMVLTGLALLFFFQAATTLIQYFGAADAVKAAVFWTVGDLGRAGWDELAITAPLVLLGAGLLCWKAHDLNIMNAGDACAKSLGIHVAGTRMFTMVVCTVMIAGVVSFTGAIGFIGLVAPHLVRMLIGVDNKILVPASGLSGAILLVASDTIARTILAPVILPVGAITAFLGVPLFVYLIIRKNGGIL